MKFISRSAFIAIVFFAASSMISLKQTRIIFFGDSITEAGVKPGGYITKIGEILQAKKDATALVVYAPKGPASIPPDKFVELNSKRNVMVTNFRGRLLNDIVVSLMTTSYQ